MIKKKIAILAILFFSFFIGIMMHDFCAPCYNFYASITPRNVNVFIFILMTWLILLYRIKMKKIDIEIALKKITGIIVIIAIILMFSLLGFLFRKSGRPIDPFYGITLIIIIIVLIIVEQLKRRK